MAKIRINCGCEDAPCCGCEEYAYTGEDAIEQEREECYPDLLPGEDMDGDHQSALASCGWGMDEDYCHDMHDIDFEDRMCGGGEDF